MYFDPRGIVLFGANALLLHLTLMVNSALSGSSLYLLLLGPMLVIPALYMRHSAYFLCTLMSGLWVDAALPTPFGLFTLSFLAAGAATFALRMRFRTEKNYHPALIAHASNAFCFLALMISQKGELLSVSTFWIQAILSMLLSHLALLVIAPWFFNLERLLFDLFRLDPDPEDLPLL